MRAGSQGWSARSLLALCLAQGLPCVSFAGLGTHSPTSEEEDTQFILVCAPQQSEDLPASSGGHRGAGTSFKARVTLIVSHAVCVGLVTQTCHGREQNSVQSTCSCGTVCHHPSLADCGMPLPKIQPQLMPQALLNITHIH